MSIKRWFDLQGQGAKLDRRVGANGSGYLELSFHDEAAMNERLTGARIEAVAQAGWVKPETRPAIRNYGDFRDFTEIARALSVVFDDETVDRAIAPREALRQAEVLEGVDRPIYVGKEHIDQSLKFLPDTIRSRAIEMIEKARERQLTFRGASLGATGGKLWELAERVSESTSVGLATSIAKLASARYDDETFEQIEKLASTPTDAARNQLDDILRRIDVEEQLLREVRKEAIALGRDRDQVEANAAAEYIMAQPDARDLVLDLDPPQAAPMPLSEGFQRDVHGFKFEVSADTTTLAAREYQARLTKAVEFIADTFGMEPPDVFEQNTRIRVVQGLVDRHTRGHQIQSTRKGKNFDGEDFVDASGAIVFSQATLGTALHEICHAIDRRLGEEPAKYDEIIHGSGLMQAFDNVLSEAKLNVSHFVEQPEYVEYLREPQEVFARVLENALRTRCLEQHGTLAPLGGHAIAGHNENYAPLDPQIMERTIQIIRNYGASRGVMTEVGLDNAEEAPVQRQPVSRTTMRGR
ncbi:hypothetical protein [Brucella intermedia]|uniref:hypothetical protein n=1 Tax=Brucella intermedia TaxID=94625 RepID=UPI002362D953|nr:hypothetical protein [Brucella intermedia]